MENKTVCNRAKVKFERLGCGYDPNVVDFRPNGPYYLRDYLQSWKYFNCCIAEIRKQLVLRPHIKKLVKTSIQRILRKFRIKSRAEVTLIGIHIRRGDMTKDLLQVHGYQVASGVFIQRAVNFFSPYSNKLFIVCSDDATWPRKHMPSNTRVEYVRGNPAHIDFGIMASCDHLITTVGTFSWWAGFLNTGKVIYFKWPAKNGTKRRQRFSKDYMDYFMPNWIGL